MRRDCVGQGDKPLFTVHPFQRNRAFAAQQKIGALLMARMPREVLREQRRLVEPAFEHPGPMQRNRSYQGVVAQQGSRHARHPNGRGAGYFLAIPMFQPKDHLAGIIPVKKRGPPLCPGAGCGYAIIAKFPSRPCFTG